MALASKKTGTIHSKSGGEKTKLKDKFDGGALDVLSDHPDDFPQNAAILYAMQNITEDLDALRTYAGSELRGAIATNTAKTPLIIGTGSGNAMAGNTTVISSTQATFIANLGKGIKSELRGALTISKDRDNNLVLTDGTHTWSIAPSEG